MTALTGAQKAAFLKSPVSLSHDLADSGLFTDEALIALLDRWPEDLYDINLFDFVDNGTAVMRTGVRGRLSGEQVLQGIKDGRVWLQLRKVHEHHPVLAAKVHDYFNGLAREMPGFRAVQINAALILSAPAARVPFHADMPNVCLFHMRGKKRLWVYPNDEAHMPQAAMENIALKQQTEDLPYDNGMDERAQVFDLEAGQAVAWPLHSPHRIENLGTFNVSLSVDYQTWGSRMTNGAHYVNGLLRRSGITPASMPAIPMAARAVLWAAHVVLRRLPLIPDRLKDYERSFELDGKPVAA